MEHEYEEISNLLEELCEYCLSDELNLSTLQEKMKKLDNHFPAMFKRCMGFVRSFTIFA